MSKAALIYCFGAATLGAGLMLLGLVSAVWHMAWWIGVALLATILLCLFASLTVFAAGPSHGGQSSGND